MPHSPSVWFKSKTTFLFVATLAVQAGSAATLSGFGCVFLDQPNGGLTCDAPSVSSSFGSAAAGKQLTGDGRATAGYTQLSVASSASFSIFGVPSMAYSDAIAYSIDSITINSSGLDGLSGRLFLSYALDGTIVTSGAGSSSVEVAISVSGESYWTSYTLSTSGTFRVPQSFEFVFGRPINFFPCLGSVTGPGVFPSGGAAPGNRHVTTFTCAAGADPTTGSGSAAADFALRLLPMIVTDSLGNPVLDAQFTSESGTQYGPGNVVPEGSSLLMLGSGLITLVLLQLATPGYPLSHLAFSRRTIQLHWLQK